MLNQHNQNRGNNALSREDYLKGLQNYVREAQDTIVNFTKIFRCSKPTDHEGGVSREVPLHLREDDNKNETTKNFRPRKVDSEKREENAYSEELLFPAPSSSQFGVVIDAAKQREILRPFWNEGVPDVRTPPKSAGELVANFSRDERLALYEYTLKNCIAVAKPPELLSMEDVLRNDNQTEFKELTPLEMKKAMRDFKRRRQAYRTKVSTKNKNQTQITREIIHNMMVFWGADEADLGSEKINPSAADDEKCELIKNSSKDDSREADSSKKKESYGREYKYKNKDKNFRDYQDYLKHERREVDRSKRKKCYDEESEYKHKDKRSRDHSAYYKGYEREKHGHDKEYDSLTVQNCKTHGDKKIKPYGYAFQNETNDSRTFTEKWEKKNDKHEELETSCHSSGSVSGDANRDDACLNSRKKSKKSKHKKKSKSKKSHRQKKASS